MIIEPSIIACQFEHLAEEVKKVEEGGADMIHVDIMDGHFVFNITIGFPILEALNRTTEMYLDVHYMGYNVFDYVERFVQSGADCVNFHCEATENVDDVIDYLWKANVHVGLALNPETPISMVENYLHRVDTILLMTVNPGFGGQPFIEESFDRIEELRNLINFKRVRKRKVVSMDEDLDAFEEVDIRVDGGISDQNIAECMRRGATQFVVGSHLFKQPDYKAAIEALRGAGKVG
ncbi:MAG: Ribulose-phosphate 3-epimerase [Chlamydiia bacterium]|nr:Ribulose-phosphate 3-epimerase [Chlamydiia bacterium]